MKVWIFIENGEVNLGIGMTGLLPYAVVETVSFSVHHQIFCVHGQVKGPNFY